MQDQEIRLLERQAPGTKRLAMAKYRAGRELSPSEKFQILEVLNREELINLYWVHKLEHIFVEGVGNPFWIVEREVMRKKLNVLIPEYIYARFYLQTAVMNPIVFLETGISENHYRDGAKHFSCGNFLWSNPVLGGDHSVRPYYYGSSYQWMRWKTGQRVSTQMLGTYLISQYLTANGGNFKLIDGDSNE